MTESHITAKVATLPGCDVHRKEHPAKYDASIQHGGRYVWAFVCEEAFQAGKGRLGLGRGQELILDTEEERSAIAKMATRLNPTVGDMLGIPRED